DSRSGLKTSLLEQAIGPLKRRLARGQARHIVGRVDAQPARQLEIVADLMDFLARTRHGARQDEAPAAAAITPAIGNAAAVGEPRTSEGVRQEQDRSRRRAT